jgi:hypothetical protein
MDLTPFFHIYLFERISIFLLTYLLLIINQNRSNFPPFFKKRIITSSNTFFCVCVGVASIDI